MNITAGIILFASSNPAINSSFAPFFVRFLASLEFLEGQFAMF